MYLDKIKKAKRNIEDIVMKTPLLYSEVFSKGCQNEVFMKCENLQLTGAYKIRGALNKIRSLTEEEKNKGVVCSSAGNHAQGVAYASSLANVKATIVMPETTPLLKIQSTKDFGGNIVLAGEVYDDAYKEAKRIEKEQGVTFLHPFNDIDVICGQGTVGLEILEDLPNVDIILCPIGGGGLISGISIAAKSINSNIKIIGVQAAGANAMEQSFKKGHLINIDKVDTIADGIAVKQPGNLTYEIIKDYVDDIVTVTDNEIVEAFFTLSEKHKLLAEASGVVSLAALKKLNEKNKKVVSVISGGNIDMVTISSLIDSALVSKGRLVCFSMELIDKPGEAVKVAQVFSSVNANIVELYHNRFKAKDKLKNVVLDVTVETNGHSHIQSIKEALINHGYNIIQVY
ncbi:threonine ammonia-lyase [Clostridium tarantellae]|uniref:L-threonine dehydratase catabolic TdcB n=1 Tax=Clostridium tarantellae TaxID=39493 RepID=A0A6I1MMY4_9CLOT|nr:threonine ammonia-lyase [Clostridium tarantellae]MPQ43477.1 threonine ammonia-lyase [Clostridium tarantellae]